MLTLGELRRVRIETISERACADGTPRGFAEALFARAAPEDLARLSDDALALLAREAWIHMAAHQAGQHHVHVYNPDLTGTDGHEFTVIEIVNDDMPFLLDSTMGELNDRGLDVRLVVHPILALERDADGRLKGFIGDANRAEAEGTARESLIHIHVERIDSQEERDALEEGLNQTFTDVRLATSDWMAIRSKLQGAMQSFRETPSPLLPADETAEAVAFLQWLLDNNFTFLGTREYAYVEETEGDRLDPIADTGLGILRDPDLRVLRRGRELVVMTPEIRAFLHEPVPLIVTKGSVRARVHRRAHLDYVGVKLFDKTGKITGELRIVGLFTGTAYTQSARTIPLLRRKIGLVEQRAGFDPESHSGKTMANVLESYPRDELFQIDLNTLFDFTQEVMSLHERPRVRALPRLDEFNRFVSILVFVPRDKFNTDVRTRIGAYLAKAYDGRMSASYPGFSEGPLARVHYIIGRYEGTTPQIDRDVLESEISQLTQTWGDRLKTALIGHYDGKRARLLASRYADAFSVSYQDAFAPDIAIRDIATLEGLSAQQTLAIAFYRRPRDPDQRVSLKILSFGRALPLSERVPVLEAMGLRAVNERTYRVEPKDVGDGGCTWVHDMTLENAHNSAIDLAASAERLGALFMAVTGGAAESDGYNALALEAGLDWRNIAMIRAMSRYLRQALIPFTHDYMWGVLVKHASITAAITELFHVRFTPNRGTTEQRAAAEAEILSRIEQGLSAVESLDEDRILRRFVNLIQAMVRTNFFQEGKAVIAFKIESAKVEALPAPRPLYEIFVYSPRVEGVHLRFGKVARGGLRWSDRPQDFRTEVLGLVKAQQVKNAVIVPVGAKGGFVPKQLPSGPRDAIFTEGTEAYKIFVTTLLELTDNLKGDELIPPPDVTRLDGDDPYLVVAADKGTATFSDTANGLAQAHSFWLDDAFASGGSAGYDHKKMGITARGGWEAVKRHFREMNTDIQTTPFTVAGVGDMSGDVFGNGMLLSPAIKLVAAFDHRDIFLDPNPDPRTSFNERQRMFELPRSSWQDYDKSLISQGGGIFPRNAKSIPLSAEVQALLGIAKASATPQEVMNAILKLPVDLLWFGGIGTYVRASTETDDQAGDRANDAIRVTGGELRAKVVGEGANLGLTQRGRIEFALRGGRINTDAIDNSAGVNSSDVEVNIKIALSAPEHEGKLNRESRNVLLAEMTEEVGGLVLRNNYQQTLALSLAERRGQEDVGFEQRLMQTLETRGLLDRAVEFLPDDSAITERVRTGQSLTRPELAVLLAYAKITLFDDLIASTVPDDPYLSRELARYFPEPMQQRFPEAIQGHKLRREIIATMLANSMINRGGPSFVVRLADQTGADVPALAAAFAAARDAYRMLDVQAAIDTLDAKIPGSLQLELYASLQDLLLSRIVWFIRNVDLKAGLEGMVQRFRKGVDEVLASLNDTLPEEAANARTQQFENMSQQGVPTELASWLSSLPALISAPDIVLVAEKTNRPASEVAATLFAVKSLLGLDRLREAARGIQVADYYERLALNRAIDGIEAAERAITAGAAMLGSGAEAVQTWTAKHPEVARVQQAVQDIIASGLTLPKLTVAASLVGDLAQHAG